ncbi:MAG TPA: VOC family protein [Caulobacteraceae bacterium]|jgi:glyoxylase I family protein|nr:VOC family protein [Caulobacteraceae bacterium]
MLKLDHVVFPVWDAGASLAFYGDTLGLPLAQTITGDDWGGRPWLMMVFALAEGRELVLVSLRGAERPPPDGLAPDVRHYAFAVDTAAEQLAWRERLATAGVAFWNEDHGDQSSLYFEDPNGIVIEITTPGSDARPPTDDRALERAYAWIDEGAALTV